MNELIRGSVVSTMTTAGDTSAAVENELNRKVNVIALAVACNLDAITEGRESTVGPTRTTVLRNVLVQRVSEVRNAVNVTPSEGVGEISGVNVRMREGRLNVVCLVVARKNLSWSKDEKARESQLVVRKISKQSYNPNRSSTLPYRTLISLKRA